MAGAIALLIVIIVVVCLIYNCKKKIKIKKRHKRDKEIDNRSLVRENSLFVRETKSKFEAGQKRLVVLSHARAMFAESLEQMKEVEIYFKTN